MRVQTAWQRTIYIAMMRAHTVGHDVTCHIIYMKEQSSKQSNFTNVIIVPSVELVFDGQGHKLILSISTKHNTIMA